METKKVITMANFITEVASKARGYLFGRVPMPKEWMYEPFTEELEMTQKKCEPLHDDLGSLGEKSRGYLYHTVALVIDLEAARSGVYNPILEYYEDFYGESLGCLVADSIGEKTTFGEEDIRELSEDLREMNSNYVTAYDFLRSEELRDSFEREFVLTAPDEYDYGKDIELDTPFRRPWEADYVNFVKNWDKDRTIAENARWYTETQKDEIREFFTYEEETD